MVLFCLLVVSGGLGLYVCMVESERVSEAVCRDFGEASRLGGEVALAVMNRFYPVSSQRSPSAVVSLNWLQKLPRRAQMTKAHEDHEEEEGGEEEEEADEKKWKDVAGRSIVLLTRAKNPAQQVGTVHLCTRPHSLLNPTYLGASLARARSEGPRRPVRNPSPPQPAGEPF